MAHGWTQDVAVLDIRQSQLAFLALRIKSKGKGAGSDDVNARHGRFGK
jgi:hypothetical protein